MQTALADFIKDTAEGTEAEQILRSCVHCGFCNATCPTYQLLGDELDGPRGRIYLIKQVLEGHEVSANTQLHLDRCLTCRSCESTCPSGVNYHRLADIGRAIIAKQVPRSFGQRMLRGALRAILPYRGRFTPMLRLGQIVRNVLPGALRQAIPAKQSVKQAPKQSIRLPRNSHKRKMLILDGCVQPAIAPNINAAAARVLDALGITLETTPNAGCCGALSYHLDAHEEGLAFMRRIIDAWWPQVETGAEAIVITASGCGSVIKDYGHLLKDDPAYAEKAARISSMTRDLAEIIADEDCAEFSLKREMIKTIAYHSPCSLQHGQKLSGSVERLLTKLGFILQPVADAHLCCGSAGTYSILQKSLSRRLRANKLAALEAADPELIATANIGCLTHLQSAAKRPVKHWIEVLDEAID